MAHFGQAGVSPDGTVAYGTVTFEGKDFNDVSTADATTALNLIKAQNGTGRPAGRRQRRLRLRRR